MIERPVSCHLGPWAEFADAARLGFDGCEITASAARRHADSLAEALEQAGLRLSAVQATTSFFTTDSVQRRAVVDSQVALARLARSAECDRLVIAGGPSRGWARPDLRVVAPVVQDVARAVAAEGVVACLLPQRGTEIAGGAELLAVLERDASGFLAACPDTAQLAIAGDDPAAVVRSCAERVAAVHLSDAAGDREPCALGAGGVDVPGVFDALDEIGFHGWVTIDAADADTACASRDYLAALGRFVTTRA